MLDEGSLLIFSTHGPHVLRLLGDGSRRGLETAIEGFSFRKENETLGRLSADYYANTFVTEGYVRVRGCRIAWNAGGMLSGEALAFPGCLRSGANIDVGGEFLLRYNTTWFIERQGHRERADDEDQACTNGTGHALLSIRVPARS